MKILAATSIAKPTMLPTKAPARTPPLVLELVAVLIY
jgi:hypothetical protein